MIDVAYAALAATLSYLFGYWLGYARGITAGRRLDIAPGLLELSKKKER